jgi:hypothetical protein
MSTYLLSSRQPPVLDWIDDRGAQHFKSLTPHCGDEPLDVHCHPVVLHAPHESEPHKQLPSAL